MDVAYAGVIPAWSQTYTSSVLSGTAWWKAKPCAASHSTSTAAPRCRHDTAIATKTAALPVGVPPLPLPTSRCSSSARETTARSAAAGTEPLTRTQQLLNGPRCTDSPARSASTAPVAVAPAASSAAVGRGGAISFELACSHAVQAEDSERRRRVGGGGGGGRAVEHAADVRVHERERRVRLREDGFAQRGGDDGLDGLLELPNFLHLEVPSRARETLLRASKCAGKLVGEF